MTSFDWILAGVLVLSLLMGAWRGLVYEVLSLLGWVASFYAAQWFAPEVSRMLSWPTASEPVRYAAAFVLLFVVALFAAGLLAALIKKMVEAIGLRPVDRTLGAAFGVLRGLILLLAATVVIEMTALKSSDWWLESNGAQMLSAGLANVKPLLPEPFARVLN